MTVLVIEDDDVSRLLMSRILTKKLSCDVYEAKNGVEGLVMINRLAPDFVILDVMMPLMDGVEVLDAIRSDPVYASLPVVIASAVADGSRVRELVRLGITDYLLKPLITDTVFKRLSRVIAQTHPSRQLTLRTKAATSDSSRQLILIVDADPNFRSFFKSVLEGRFVVLEAEGGAEGLELFLCNRPSLVFLGEGLRLPNAHKLTEKIRSTQGAEKTRIYLYSATKTSSELPSTEFNGVLRKSFVPDVFLKEFEHIVLGEGDFYEPMVAIICGQLRSDIVTAIQQTFGMMAMQEIELLDSQTAGEIQQGVRASLGLVEDTRRIEVTIGLTGTKKDVMELAGRVQGMSCGSLDVAEDAYGEIINTIGGRIRTSMDHYGIRLRPETPAVQAVGEQDREYDWKLSVPFRTEGGGHYMLGVAIERSTTPAVAPDGRVVC